MSKTVVLNKAAVFSSARSPETKRTIGLHQFPIRVTLEEFIPVFAFALVIIS